MSHEILYTSAPKLLKAGVSGYGTVISTRGISSHLAEKLEGLSGYRWAFEQGDPQARLNPVCYSHVTITVAGQRYHVLSRVSDYGADYSGRSNKIAHHVALADTELTAGGPAWLLKSPGFCESTWDQQTRVIEAGRQPTRSVRSSADYSSWKRATGDAGWAGVLAETALAKERRPVHVIFPLGMDTLSLVEEALNLLPHRERWKVSFSTYYNSLPASVDCQWRFILDGTPEAANLRRQPHQTIIDLCSQLGLPAGGELIERAREGWQPTLATSSSTPTRLPSKDRQQKAGPAATVPQFEARNEAPLAAYHDPKVDVRSSVEPEIVPPVLRRIAPFLNQNDAQPSPYGSRIPTWGLFVLCLLVGGAAGAGGFWLGHRSAAKKLAAPDREIASTSTVHTNTSAKENVQSPLTSSHSSQQSIRINEGRSNAKDVASTSLNGESENSLPQPTAEAIIMAPLKQTKTQSPLATSEPPMLPTPEENNDDGRVSADDSQPVGSHEVSISHLDIPVWDAQQYENKTLLDSISRFEPRVFGSILALGPEENFQTVRIDGSLTWDLKVKASPPTILSESPVAIDSSIGGKDGTVVGTFSLNKESLVFRWVNNTDKRYVNGFRKCMLQVDDSGKFYQLSKPLILGPLDLLNTKIDQDGDLCEMIPASVIPSVGKWSPNKAFGEKFHLVKKDGNAKGDKKGMAAYSAYITDLDQNRIAEIVVELHSVNDSDENHPIMLVRTYALPPGDGGEATRTPWTVEKHNDKENEYHKNGIQKERKEITGIPDGSGDSTYKEKKMAWAKDVDDAWDESGVIRSEAQRAIVEERVKNKTIDPLLYVDNLGNLNEAGKTYRRRILRKIDKNIKRLEVLRKKELWASSMEMLMSSLESGASVSFDLYYEVEGGETPLIFTVAVVTASMTSDTGDKSE